jgi:hypothetical protein
VPVQRFGGARGRLGLLLGDRRAPLAQYSRRDAARIIECDGRNVHGCRAERRDALERVGDAVVHEDRASTRAHSLGDLAEDRGRRFLQGECATEDLRDRVEEVYLLVALGELVGRVLHLETAR